ncbi:Methyltransferase domain-containing protein [Jatrophihabitans endophyticus]|uniref:Methyltransferase domain-containing protein n=1 Tax=Jatrophihabitans endophyticus TaxID=1206085 RepID=A0A1M5IT29_9ACTN|nr:class I SAM-dependent methyltransferase [Jatrophihabitans endophyticus]SHG31416.1 Methyltransferase domain-containing protein [Jatrophihabitans endophyticus]
MLPWDHNAYYDRLLLRAVPAGAERVLDVGCGAGRLAGALAARVRHVDALDRDPTMIDAARRRVPDNVDCRLADVTTVPLPAGHYDAIVSMTALHHLPLAATLARLAEALRPGGVLAVVALPRRDLPRELPVELVASTWHHLIGLVLAAGGDRTRPGSPLRHDPDHRRMPTRDAELTTRQVREQARVVLPGVHVCRLLALALPADVATSRPALPITDGSRHYDPQVTTMTDSEGLPCARSFSRPCSDS